MTNGLIIQIGFSIHSTRGTWTTIEEKMCHIDPFIVHRLEVRLGSGDVVKNSSKTSLEEELDIIAYSINLVSWNSRGLVLL